MAIYALLFNDGVLFQSIITEYPVGGYLLPVNNLAIIISYFVFIAIMIIYSVLIIKKRYE